MWCRTALGVFVAGVFVTHAAWAAEPIDPFSLSPEQLFDATVMSVSKTDEKLGDAPAAIFVLTSEDIQRAGVTSIPEALRLVPGVQVARIGTGGWAISVRGFNSQLANKLLVLIDGREVYDPLFSGVYWDVQDTPLLDIDRIEVIRGPGASLWGANAVNGVINIITKPAAQTAGALVAITAGNEERAIVTARYGGDVGQNGHWRIYGKYFDRGPQETLAGTDANDDWQAWRGGFRVDWDEDERGNSFTVQGDAYESETGQYRSVPQITPPYAVVQPETITANGGNLLARWNRELGEDSRFAVQAYVDRTHRRQLTIDDKRTTVDVDAQYEFPAWDRHKIIAGGRYRFSDDSLEGSSIISFTNATRSDQVVSGFVEDKITLLADSWFFTLGSKFEHNDYSGFEIQPNARLQWVGEQQMGWASVSRAVRTPSRLEQDLDIVAGVLPPGALPVPVKIELKPSPDFDSEVVIAYEAGYRRQWSPSFFTDISAFYNDYDRLSTLTFLPPEIVLDPLHAILPVRMTNLTKAETYGGEAVIGWRAAPNLNFSAAYSVLEMNLTGPGEDVAIASEAAEDQSPEQQFNIRAQWDATDRLALDGTVYYVDSLPGHDVDAYWRFDMRIGWRLTEQIHIDLVGQNLFSARHREFTTPTEANAVRIDQSIYGKIVWHP